MKICDCPTSCSGRWGSRGLRVRRRASPRARPARMRARSPSISPIGSARCVRSIAAGSRVSSPCSSKPPGNGKQLAALAICRQRAVGELRHRDVEHDRRAAACGIAARNGDDQRIVADCGRCRSPRRQVGQRVGPAHRGEAGFGRLPAVASAAHPVRGVGQRDGAETVSRAPAPLRESLQHARRDCRGRDALSSAPERRSSRRAPVRHADRCVRSGPSRRSAAGARCRACERRRDRSRR